MSLLNGAVEAMKELTTKMVGIEEQQKQLNTLMNEFVKTRTGNSCIVAGIDCYGRGRKSAINRAIEQVGIYKHQIERYTLSVASLGSDANALTALETSKNKDELRVVILEDADELCSRQRQTLLYRTLNSTMSMPWMIFLLIEREDFVDCLEKRVRSRLSRHRINFFPSCSIDEYRKCFQALLTTKRAHSSPYTQFVEKMLSSASVDRNLRKLFEFNPSYGTLKKAVALFLTLLTTMDEENINEADIIWAEAVEMIYSSESPLLPLLRGLSLRCLCVLLCVLRRLKTTKIAAVSITYKTICDDYSMLCNTADGRMLASSLLIYREIDRLVELGFLITDRRMNNIAFRRVSSVVNLPSLEEMLLKKLDNTIPINIIDFYNTTVNR